MNRIKIGWGRREISLNEPVSINGQVYTRISEGIKDPLLVTALCLDGGKDGDAVVFCSCDLTSVRCGLTNEVIENVSSMNSEIPTDAIILNATHSHSSMDIRETPKTSPDGAYIYPGAKVRAHVAKKAAEAICEAWDSRLEGGMGYGYGYAVVGHSRRSIYSVDMSVKKPNAVAPNGHGVMYGKTNDPDFSGYEAGADHFLNVMFTFDKNNKLTGMVINVPCPSQTSEHLTMLSADYWNEVREGIAKEFGKDVYILPQCAAAGDLSPRILHYFNAQKRRYEMKYGLTYEHNGSMKNINKIMGDRYDIASRIIEGVTEVYSWAKKDIQTDVPVRHRRIEASLKRRPITDEDVEWCKTNIENMKNQIPDMDSCTPEEYRVAMSRYNSIKGRNSRAIERAEELKTEPNLLTTLHTVQVGEISFASNQFELYMDYMHRIQARSPFIQTFIVQLAGDEGGSYLATERGVLNKGYSASIFCNSVGPEGGQQLVETTLDMLEDMKDLDNNKE